MRLRMLLAALSTGALVVLLLRGISSKEARITKADALPHPLRTTDAAGTSVPSNLQPTENVPPPVVPTVSDPAAEKSDRERVADRIANLMDLAMTDDVGSLTSILLELNDPDPRIREAAVIAAVQFGNADAVPALRDAGSRTDDPEEKTEILKAIDFLSQRQSQDLAQ